MEAPVARVSLQAVVFQPEAERRARPADDPHVSHARRGLLELIESMNVCLSGDFSFLVLLSFKRFLESAASASHRPPEPRSSGPECRDTIANDPTDTKRPRPGTEVVVVVVMVVVCGVWCVVCGGRDV